MTCSRINYQAPVFQKLDNAIHWINHFPVDKHKGNQLHYPVDRDLSDTIHLFNKCSLRILLLLNVIIILLFIMTQLAQVVQMWNSAIYQILITIEGRFPFVRTDRPDHSCRNDNFTFNNNFPARSVTS